MICSSCGTENKAGRKFCIRCGNGLVLTCGTCGSPLEPDASFCGECGTPVAVRRDQGTGDGAPRQPLAAVTTPVAERRLVSILFADLVGFTSLAEGRDAEETRELLSRYFDLCGEVIGRYGGTVEKFIGDAVMAVWGAPTAHEDDAERAVRAALELVGAVPRLGPSVQARAGVLTGEAAVTIGATNQGMVAGDLVNTASRLQSVAAPATVLVGEATQRAAGKAIAFEPAGEHVVKGKTVPIPAFRALRVVAERGGRNRSEALEAPFVGRDDELRLLKDLFHATSRERRPRLVSVIGAGGIGKTRLAWEFLKYIDGLVETILWHDGRSPAYGDGISFWALGEMVRGRCRLVETDDEPTTRAKVTETLATYVPDESERRWIEPALLTLLGVDTGIRSEQLFGAWRTFFERLAASAPVVMVFEDLHHADAGLLDFIDHVLEWSRNVPIYVLTLARPELLERRPGWGASKRNFTSLYLDPLTEPAMRELLSGLVPGLPDSTVRTIVARAGGIPLYAVETVRMLLAEGRLARENGAYRPVGDLADLAVPETLTALIASRLDGLDPSDRALVSDAAVLGQSFTVAGLSAVSGVSEAELESRLRSLVRRELLTLEADPRSPERGQYGFVQALIREVAYNTLARADRKSRHLAAARFFESLGNDELAGGLAGHYLAAHANSPEGLERDALAAQSRVALRAAAERAAGLGSFAQAVTFYGQALTVTTDSAEQAQIHERAGECAALIERVDEAEVHFRAAIGLRSAAGDRAGEARVTAAFGRALLGAYRFKPGLAVLAAASERFPDLGDDPALLLLDSQLARAYMFDEDHVRAVVVADRVLASAEHSDLIELVADTLITRGTALAWLGRPYEGLGAIETGHRLGSRHGLDLTVARALNNIAALSGDSDPRAGLEAARAGIVLARRLGYRHFQILDNASQLALRTGDWDWAVAQVEPMLGDDVEPLTRAVALADIITIRAFRGEPIAEALADLEALPTSGADPVKAGTVAVAQTSAAFAAAQYDVARAAAHQYAQIFAQGGLELFVIATRCALLARKPELAAEDLARVEGSERRGAVVTAERKTLRAGLAALDGRTDEALTQYRESLHAWRDLGLPWDEALCALDMATLLDPSEPEVGAAAEAARAILTRLQATPFLARLEEAMHRPASPVPPHHARSREASSV